MGVSYNDIDIICFNDIAVDVYTMKLTILQLVYCDYCENSYYHNTVHQDIVYGETSREKCFTKLCHSKVHWDIGFTSMTNFVNFLHMQ